MSRDILYYIILHILYILYCNYYNIHLIKICLQVIIYLNQLIFLKYSINEIGNLYISAFYLLPLINYNAYHVLIYYVLQYYN